MALDSVSQGPDVHASLRDELLRGLHTTPRYINPKFFYDERGSELFNRICELPEYYPTRTEIAILQAHAAEIAVAVGEGCQLVEPGAGSCEKVRHVLPALRPERYVPLDISGDFLLAAVDELQQENPELAITPVVADFNADFNLPPTRGHRVLFYPGSTIGNFTPEGAVAFLERAATLVGEGGGLLIGVDLHKDPDVLNAAYNDREGVTAAFNRNILNHANHLLDADFDPEAFDHLAFYDEGRQRIEMHLVSTRAQSVRGEGLALELAAGERIHTEYSFKYRPDQFAAMASRAGFVRRAQWTDPRGWFGVQYFALD